MFKTRTGEEDDDAIERMGQEDIVSSEGEEGEEETAKAEVAEEGKEKGTDAEATTKRRRRGGKRRRGKKSMATTAAVTPATATTMEKEQPKTKLSIQRPAIVPVPPPPKPPPKPPQQPKQQTRRYLASTPATAEVPQSSVPAKPKLTIVRPPAAPPTVPAPAPAVAEQIQPQKKQLASAIPSESAILAMARSQQQQQQQQQWWGVPTPGQPAPIAFVDPSSGVIIPADQIAWYTGGQTIEQLMMAPPVPLTPVQPVQKQSPPRRVRMALEIVDPESHKVISLTTESKPDPVKK